MEPWYEHLPCQWPCSCSCVCSVMHVKWESLALLLLSCFWSCCQPVMSSGCTMSILHSQENRSKAMVPLCEWALQAGMGFVEVVQRLEKKPGGKMGPSSFKILESFKCPEDFQELMAVMLQDETRCNMAAIKTVSKAILQKRWWHWVLTHPELGPEYIHPDRSMYHPHGITKDSFSGFHPCTRAHA